MILSRRALCSILFFRQSTIPSRQNGGPKRGHTSATLDSIFFSLPWDPSLSSRYFFICFLALEPQNVMVALEIPCQGRKLTGLSRNRFCQCGPAFPRSFSANRLTQYACRTTLVPTYRAQESCHACPLMTSSVSLGHLGSGRLLGGMTAVTNRFFAPLDLSTRWQYTALDGVEQSATWPAKAQCYRNADASRRTKRETP